MRAVPRCTGARIVRSTTTSAIAPSGRLTKKIQRHDRYSENSPPAVGPTTADMPQTLAR
jgi:hypothetical protein